jgi:hypothetical protein
MSSRLNWTTWRGVEAMDNSYRLLDLTVYGRRETWEDSPTGWPQRFEGKQNTRTDGRPTATSGLASKPDAPTTSAPPPARGVSPMVPSMSDDQGISVFYKNERPGVPHIFLLLTRHRHGERCLPVSRPSAQRPPVFIVARLLRQRSQRSRTSRQAGRCRSSKAGSQRVLSSGFGSAQRDERPTTDQFARSRQ